LSRLSATLTSGWNSSISPCVRYDVDMSFPVRLVYTRKETTTSISGSYTRSLIEKLLNIERAD